jgi:AcrR family transcriptional regulator
VPVDATATRERLLDEAERLFALHGVDGAQIRDIVRAAGQANDSAVHYHFQSREGLLGAICQRRITEMEPARARLLDEVAAAGGLDDLPALITTLIVPTAALLHTQEGRYFLGITAQLAGRAGIRTRTIPPPMITTTLRRQLDLVQAACSHVLPENVVLERIAIVIGMLTTALSDRASQLDSAAEPLLDHDDFVINLEAMIVAALLAPSAQGSPLTR